MRIWGRWALAVGWAGVIFGLSALPSSGRALPPGVDKVGHLVLYGILGFLLLSAGGGSPPLSARASLWTVLICALYGASDEFHQMFVPGRECNLWDWVADVVGAVLVVVVVSRRRGASGAGVK